MVLPPLLNRRAASPGSSRCWFHEQALWKTVLSVRVKKSSPKISSLPEQFLALHFPRQSKAKQIPALYRRNFWFLDKLFSPILSDPGAWCMVTLFLILTHRCYCKSCNKFLLLSIQGQFHQSSGENNSSSLNPACTFFVQTVWKKKKNKQTRWNVNQSTTGFLTH